MTTCLGKSCSFGLPRVPFVNCRQSMYLVISLLVLRTGCGIWLYQFLIIAYLFTFFTSEDTKRFKLCSCQNVCEALIYLLDNIYIRFGTKLYRQIVGIPMGTNCAPLVADLFLFCYERDFMTSLSDVKQAEIIEAFKSTSRYLDDLLNIDNPYFEGMVNRIYPPELQLNKANTSDTEAPFLDLHLSISNGFVSSEIYNTRDDFDFDIVNFHFWMVTFPVLPLTGFTFLNLFGLLECLVMWLISMPVIKV